MHRLALTTGFLAVMLLAIQVLAWVRLSPRLLHEVARAQLASVPLAALIVSVTGIASAWLLARARRGGDATRVARMARWPQALVMVACFKTGSHGRLG
jgi:hypothetical protein